MRPAVDAIARTRAAAKEAGSDDYSSLLYFFPFVSTPLLSLPFGAPNYDHPSSFILRAPTSNRRPGFSDVLLRMQIPSPHVNSILSRDKGSQRAGLEY